jgi:WD40 repeat protein
LITASLDGAVQVVDADSGDELGSFEIAEAFGLDTVVGAISFSPNGELAAVYLADFSALWIGPAEGLLDGAPQGEVISWTDYAGPVAMVSIDPGWETLAWISRDTLQLMTIGGEPIGEPSAHIDWLFNQTFIPGLDLLLVTTREEGAEGVILGYSLTTGNLERRIESAHRITAFSVDAAGALASTGHEDGSIRFWDLSDGSLGGQIEPDEFGGPVQQVVFTPDGSLVAATDGEQGVWLLDPADGAGIRYLPFDSPGLAWIGFDSEGKVLVVVRQGGQVAMYGAAP